MSMIRCLLMMLPAWYSMTFDVPYSLFDAWRYFDAVCSDFDAWCSDYFDLPDYFTPDLLLSIFDFDFISCLSIIYYSVLFIMPCLCSLFRYYPSSILIIIIDYLALFYFHFHFDIILSSLSFVYLSYYPLLFRLSAIFRLFSIPALIDPAILPIYYSPFFSMPFSILISFPCYYSFYSFDVLCWWWLFCSRLIDMLILPDADCWSSIIAFHYFAYSDIIIIVLMPDDVLIRYLMPVYFRCLILIFLICLFYYFAWCSRWSWYYYFDAWFFDYYSLLLLFFWYLLIILFCFLMIFWYIVRCWSSTIFAWSADVSMFRCSWCLSLILLFIIFRYSCLTMMILIIISIHYYYFDYFSDMPIFDDLLSLRDILSMFCHRLPYSLAPADVW